MLVLMQAREFYIQQFRAVNCAPTLCFVGLCLFVVILLWERSLLRDLAI